MDNVLTVIGLIFGFALMIWVIYKLMWNAKKYYGISFTTRSGYNSAASTAHFMQYQLRETTKNDPEGINSAIHSCSEKGYKMTTENIMEEYWDIRDRKNNVETTSFKVKNIFLGILHKIGYQQSKSLEERLKELETYRQNGTLNQEEFEIKRKQIIESF